MGGGARGEEKRRPDGTSAPEGWLGEVRVSRARRDPWGLEDQGGNAAVSPAHAGPGKPAGLPGLVLCLLGPPPAVWVLGSWWGGEEEERWMGRDPLESEDQGNCS